MLHSIWCLILATASILRSRFLFYVLRFLTDVKYKEVPFNDYDDEEETVKMVQLVKTQDPTVRDT